MLLTVWVLLIKRCRREPERSFESTKCLCTRRVLYVNLFCELTTLLVTYYFVVLAVLRGLSGMLETFSVDRWVVLLETGERKRVRPSNLEIVCEHA